MATVYLDISEFKFWYKTNPRKLVALIKVYVEIETKKNPFADKDPEGKPKAQTAYVDQVFF